MSGLVAANGVAYDCLQLPLGYDGSVLRREIAFNEVVIYLIHLPTSLGSMHPMSRRHQAPRPQSRSIFTHCFRVIQRREVHASMFVAFHLNH